MAHPSEARLLALIHGELPTGTAAESRAHLAECTECASVLEALRTSDAEIGELLGMLDHPTPGVRPPAIVSRSPRVRRAALAASLALLIAGAAAAAVPGTPLHRWIQSRLDVSRDAGPSREHAPPPIRPNSSSGQSVGGVEVPTSRTLTVSFGTSEQGGQLTVARTDRPNISLHAFGGDVAYQIGEGSISVDNRRPAGRYELEVPAGLRHLTVLLGGRVVFDSDSGHLEPTKRSIIPLSPESTR